jgi:hypothetical protein
MKAVKNSINIVNNNKKNAEEIVKFKGPEKKAGPDGGQPMGRVSESAKEQL